MSYVLTGTRANQKSALMAGIGYNGNIDATLQVVDPVKLRFSADVTYFTGVPATPSVTITPANEDGSIRVFASVDDLYKWCAGAFKSMTTFDVACPDISVLNKVITIPSDPKADATRQRTGWQNQKARGLDKIADLNAKKLTQEGLGYNLPSAPIQAQQSYAENNLRIATLEVFDDWYDSEIARLTGIINA